MNAANDELEIFRLVNLSGEEGVNELACSCGMRLYPDDDHDSDSLIDTFERHIALVHGWPL